MLKRFDKRHAGLGCKGTIFGTHIFTRDMEGYLDELVWGFLKKGMQVYPHKHSQKELYIFTSGRGTMQVGDEKIKVKTGDVVFIPSKSLHTAWNTDDADLEFILVRTRSLQRWMKNLVRIISR